MPTHRQLHPVQLASPCNGRAPAQTTNKIMLSPGQLERELRLGSSGYGSQSQPTPPCQPPPAYFSLSLLFVIYMLLIIHNFKVDVK